MSLRWSPCARAWVELCVGDGAWSRKEFSQAEAAHQYMAGAVAGAARPSTGGWINGRVRFRLLEGERVVVIGAYSAQRIQPGEGEGADDPQPLTIN